jgi:hypothetical protein
MAELSRRPHGTGQVYTKWGAYYGRWRAPDGRRFNRRLGVVRERGSAEGLTRRDAERVLRKLIEAKGAARPAPADEPRETLDDAVNARSGTSCCWRGLARRISRTVSRCNASISRRVLVIADSIGCCPTTSSASHSRCAAAAARRRRSPTRRRLARTGRRPLCHSDAHAALKGAIRKVLNCAWQRGTVHFCATAFATLAAMSTGSCRDRRPVLDRARRRSRWTDAPSPRRAGGAAS